MELIFLLLIIFFIALRLFLNSPGYKGRSGERKIGNRLREFAGKSDGARCLHNIILYTRDGTTQIDHILVSETGIFVIETKNMSGWIFGGERQKKWTQVIYKKKTIFQNPLHQNYKHVKAVQNLLEVDEHLVINVVVFAGDAEFKTKMPENVVTKRNLSKYLESFNQRLFSQEKINRYASLIQSANSDNLVTNKEHIRNVRNSRKAPVCPKCGGPMLLRTAGKGSNKGKSFWGCAKFPACRGIKNIG